MDERSRSKHWHREPSPAVTAPASAHQRERAAGPGQQEVLLQNEEIQLPLPQHLSGWQVTALQRSALRSLTVYKRRWKTK